MVDDFDLVTTRLAPLSLLMLLLLLLSLLLLLLLVVPEPSVDELIMLDPTLDDFSLKMGDAKAGNAPNEGNPGKLSRSDGPPPLPDPNSPRDARLRPK